MATWTHLMCDGCWIDHRPDRIPVRVKDDPIQPCCFCSTITSSGIYVRHNPDSAELECDGVHE